jgi:hypothetical protein
MRIWKPNVTVAAVVERDGRFLVVEEETEDGLRFNQPAGHLEQGSRWSPLPARRWRKRPIGSGPSFWSASTSGRGRR